MSRRLRWRPRLRAHLCGLLLLAGCGDPDAGRAGAARGDGTSGDPLLVMAAASLSGAMPALIERFEAETGTQVDLALGATGNLAAQIEHGAPADLFFAADEVTIERMAAGGSIRPGSVRPYTVGRLALVWRAQAEPPASLEALVDERYPVLAIANPEIAPYGAAAREALRRAGVWEALQPRIVRGENVAQTYQLVQTGNADIALVARSVVDSATTPFLPIDPGLHAPLRQAAGILQRSDNPAAAEFLDYVTAPAGQEILAAHGFGAAAR